MSDEEIIETPIIDEPTLEDELIPTESMMNSMIEDSIADMADDEDAEVTGSGLSVAKDSVSLETTVNNILKTYLGDELSETLLEYADIVNAEEIDAADNLLIFGGRTRNEIKFAQLRKGPNFTYTDENKANTPLTISGIEVGSLSPSNAFSDERIRKTLENKVLRLNSGPKSDDKRAEQAQRLSNIRRSINSLTSVFGFDDPRQAEAFIAAWLMKDSTCRLSGIPGTGKTTVVESAALLMANSYGFDDQLRFYPKDPSDPESDFLIFENGQQYEAYLNDNKDGIRDIWNNWRFTEWYSMDPKQPTKKIANPGVSGSYLYDFGFLAKKYSVMEEQVTTYRTKLGSISRDLYRKALLNCWLYKEKKTNPLDGSDYNVYKIMPINLGLEAFGAGMDGKIVAGTAHPNDPNYKAQFTVDYAKLLTPGLKEKLTGSMTMADLLQSLDFRTDAGRNEGFALREWLMSHYYDERRDRGDAGRSSIKGEMLREIGIAKIDYDKRADEVLYGMDIRQVTRKDPNDPGKTISAYDFEPIPRPVVTQPIKFFNEANRSQSGVEDAILGLIAEKTVEYRGRSFRSPSFVAWMDTNPHQKGNDLAFVDRIDMELLFSTLTLGDRYMQLKSQYKDRFSLEDADALSQPQDLVIFDSEIGMASDSPNRARSMRITDLMKLWKYIDGIPFTNGGRSMMGYDGLRDISLISVMFTQRYMTRPIETTMGSDQSRKAQLPDSQNIHSSPLIDISKTTNQDLLEGNSPTTQFETENAASFGSIGTDGSLQAPALFKRVLGFRFTKSLVKLSRTFAFLRGKDFVTRTEILDALPYVIGHRMGPARAGNDPKGRDLGTVTGGLGVLPSEQELIRELFVSGYVKPVSGDNSDDGSLSFEPLYTSEANPQTSSRKNTLLDVWDTVYQRCVATLASCDNFAQYEAKILHPLKQMLNGEDAENAENTTPIHWHIATMVVEQERKEKELSRCLRTEDGLTYRQRYNKYFRAINIPTDVNESLDMEAPSTAEGIQIDYSLLDYYILRSKIASDPLLFTDDRTYLLNLVEARITTFAGPAFNVASEDAIQVPIGYSNYYLWNESSPLIESYQVHPNPGTYDISTYSDALGAYGQLMQGSKKIDLATVIGEIGKDNDDIFNLTNDATVGLSYEMSNQKMQVSGSYLHRKESDGSYLEIDRTTARSPGTYLASMDAITDKFRAWCDSGVIMAANGSIQSSNADFELTMEDLELAAEAVLANPNQSVSKSLAAAGVDPTWELAFEDTGLFFCFDLAHYSASRKAHTLLVMMKEQGLIDEDATDIPNDKLKLWVWIAAKKYEDDDAGTATWRFITTYGITSGFLADTKIIRKGDGSYEMTVPGSFVAIDSQAFYDNCGKANSWSPAGDDTVPFMDAGNLTEADAEAYHQLFLDALFRANQGS